MRKILSKGPFIILALWILTALLADFLASSNPLFVKTTKGWNYIGPYKEFDPNQQIIEKEIWTPVPFSPDELDLSNNRFSEPGSKISTATTSRKHYLGTDRVGRDILSGLIHGARFSLIIVFLAVLCISIIGTIIGILMGFLGDNRASLSFLDLGLVAISIFLAVFWGIKLKVVEFALGITLLIIIFWALSRFLKTQLPFLFSKRYRLPVDYILSRFLEIFETIPKLFLLLVLVSLWDPGVDRLILALVLTGWVTLAKMVRGKALNLSNSTLFESLKSLGSNWTWSIRHHIIPFILPDVLAYVAYISGNIILIESALTFLGLGVGPDVVSWGSLLSLSVYKPDFWWLAVLPGLFIFAVVFSLVRIGDLLYERLNPEQTNWRYHDLV